MNRKHDYHNAVTGEYLFSHNFVDDSLIRTIEAGLLPIRVYRNNQSHFAIRHDRRHVRYETERNGSADGRGYYKYSDDAVAYRANWNAAFQAGKARLTQSQ